MVINWYTPMDFGLVLVNVGYQDTQMNGWFSLAGRNPEQQ